MFLYFDVFDIVGLFLPSYDTTKIAFLKAVLTNEKRALKQMDVKTKVVPKFPELSVKNIYDDAIGEPLLS